MKRLITLGLIILILISVCGCQNQMPTPKESSKVTVNMPTDDTVNGYRDPEKDLDSGAIIKVTDVTAVTESYYLYCANISSKKFHKDGCSSINNIKEENRRYTNKRESLIEEGFVPCKSCNP